MNELTVNLVVGYLRDLYEEADIALAGDSNDVEHNALLEIMYGIENILYLMGQPIARDDE